jgi:hypothetical protein
MPLMPFCSRAVRSPVFGAFVRALGWAIAAVIAGVAVYAYPTVVRNWLFWVALGVICCFGLSAVRCVFDACLPLIRPAWRPKGNFSDILIMVVTGVLSLVAVELYFAYAEPPLHAPPPIAAELPVAAMTESLVIRTGRAEIVLPAPIVKQAADRLSLITMPDDWMLVPMTIPGVTRALKWHGVVHIHDERGFRRENGPFPHKKPGTFRVMVVGDSLTYGDGIEREWTYSVLLEQLLGKDYDIEFINPGRTERRARTCSTSLSNWRPSWTRI